MDIKACLHSCHQLACDSGEKIRLTYSHTQHTDLLSSAGQVIFEEGFFANWLIPIFEGKIFHKL